MIRQQVKFLESHGIKISKNRMTTYLQHGRIFSQFQLYILHLIGRDQE